MPDLNLDNSVVRDELVAILDFWLNTVWADGFLMAEAWEELDAIARYCASSIDSFFLFPVSQSEGYLAKVLSPANRHPGQSYGDYTTLLEERLPSDTVPAPFLENHDTGRTVGFTGLSNPDKTKMAFGLLAMMQGDRFLYYGQEIGMVGSGDDPNKRIGMLWTSKEETTTPPPGVTALEYAYPSVAEQESDKNSLLNYYKKALAMRRDFPAIARGTSAILPCEEPRLCFIRRSGPETEVLLVLNPSAAPLTGTLPNEAVEFQTLAAFLCADAEQAVRYVSDSLYLPPWSIAILTKT